MKVFGAAFVTLVRMRHQCRLQWEPCRRSCPAGEQHAGASNQQRLTTYERIFRESSISRRGIPEQHVCSDCVCNTVAGAGGESFAKTYERVFNRCHNECLGSAERARRVALHEAGRPL